MRACVSMCARTCVRAAAVVGACVGGGVGVCAMNMKISHTPGLTHTYPYKY